MPKVYDVTVYFNGDEGKRQEYTTRLGESDLEVMLQDYFLVDEDDEDA